VAGPSIVSSSQATKRRQAATRLKMLYTALTTTVMAVGMARSSVVRKCATGGAYAKLWFRTGISFHNGEYVSTCQVLGFRPTDSDWLSPPRWSGEGNPAGPCCV
jgi:hypothetical protein